VRKFDNIAHDRLRHIDAMYYDIRNRFVAFAAIAIFLAFMPAARATDIVPGVEPAVVGNARVEVMFTPEQDATARIAAAIAGARRQVLMQAYSFTHDGIARALLEAHARGVDVRLIADREQTEKMARGQVPGLARAGLPVWLDGEHQGAHNKVMVVDAGTASALVVTGSFNFTRAAQHKNAENIVFISGNEGLVRAYVRNWQNHIRHAKPLTIH